MGKIIGWLLSASLTIAGLSFAREYSITGFMPYVGFMILCFGSVFLMSKTTYNNSKRIMTATTVIIVGSGFLAKFFAADIIEYYFGLGFYESWEICMLVIGGPVMVHIYKTEPT